jgi:subtilisin family serine protease
VKRIVRRIVLPLFVLLPLPFVYNACHGGLIGSSGFSSSSNASSSCKMAIAKGVVTKLEFHDDQPPAPFAAGKVRLSGSDAGPNERIQAKATSTGLSLANGTHLSVIIDNKCLQTNVQALSSQVISKAAAASGELSSVLDRQAYEWILDRDYNETEIQNLANAESCVMGVSWNKTYTMQSLSFDDPNISLQTHLPADNALGSYDYFYNSSGGMATSGTPLALVAVIDTGVDWQHPDIQNNIWVHSQGVGIDITTLGTSSVDYNPYDVSTNGHGTHVSGMIAGVANNSTGIIGAMPYRAQIMAIKLFKSDGQGGLTTTSQYFYNAMKFAYLNGANVINLSLGSITSGAATDALAESGVDEAVAHGVTVITVIGNATSGNGVLIDGTTMSSIPGQYASKTGVIGVGAYDTTTGQKSYFSHYSTTYAEIGAPGEESPSSGLYSTIPRALGNYGRLSGTSQAAPQVSAAAALTIAMIRNAYGVVPTPAEVERLILTSADKSAALAPYFKSGNKLDFMTLVAQINNDYPNTKSPGLAALPVTSGCN